VFDLAKQSERNARIRRFHSKLKLTFEKQDTPDNAELENEKSVESLGFSRDRPATRHYPTLQKIT
jgi:hypothetical protein